MVNYYALTQWKLNTKSDEIKIHIYKMPVLDMEKIHHENGQIVSQLRKQNKYKITSFCNSYIASFEKLENWKDVPGYDKYEFRTIDISNPTERALLERMILKKLENTNNHKGFRGLFIFERVEHQKDFNDVIAKRALSLDVHVDREGFIYIGFELVHRFFRKENILKKVLNGSIEKGTELMDTQSKHYLYLGLDGTTVSDYNEALRKSILEYYESVGREREVAHVPTNTPTVIVTNKNSSNYQIVYPPQLLFEACTYEQLGHQTVKKVNSYIKLSPHDKMTISIALLTEILNNNRHFLRYDKKGLLVQNQNYKVMNLNSPKLLFGNGQTSFNTISALRNGHIFDSEKKNELTIHFFTEDIIVQSLREKNDTGEKVLGFIKDIKELSLRLGIELNIHQSSKEIVDYTNVSFKSNAEFKQKLKKISSQLEHLTIVLASEKNAETCYETLKKECARHDIPTQVVTMKTLDIREKGKEYALLNILLGIYAKAGIQPWILAEQMNSDCYIGLDVSHENGRHSTGIVQVVGKDGRILDSGPMSSTEAGEIIRLETLEEIVSNAVYKYEEEFKERPKHITFHRDGKGHDSEIESLKKITDEYQIDFDYISIIKNANRRMCVIESEGWKTEIGLVYMKEKNAFLTATNPHSSVGMAKPIKITQLHGTLNFKDVIQDIYSLSYMHIGALNKSRLPITIHYADLSSTYYNRGLIPVTNTGKSLHFL